MIHIELKLLTDACFATGGERRGGDVDTDVTLDARYGLPLVRGRTLKGLLVEEVASILHALEPTLLATDAPAALLGSTRPSHDGPWHRAAGRLFGRPHTEASALSFLDGALSSSLQSEVRRRVTRDGRSGWLGSEVIDALTVVRSQTRIDADTGAAESGSLRSSRLLRAGLRFSFPVRTDALSSLEKGLLAGAVASLEQAGLHRNRGWGRVRGTVLVDGVDITSSWLAGLLQPPDEHVAPAVTATPATIPADARRQAPTLRSPVPHVVTYLLKVTSPVCLAASNSNDSTVSTLPYVTGASILGALASRWIKRHTAPDPAADHAGDPEFRRLFLNGDVRYLNAYPADETGRRLLPLPRSLCVDREADPVRTVLDRAAPGWLAAKAENEAEGGNGRSKVRWQAPLLPFVHFGGDSGDGDGDRSAVRWRATGVSLRMHINRSDARESGRPTHAGVYSVESIHVGEVLAGVVLCSRAEDAEQVRELLTAGPLALGRSKGASYGMVEVEEVCIAPAERWQEAAPDEGDDSQEGDPPLVVTFLSDAIGRNAAGTPDPEAVIAAITSAVRAHRGPSEPAVQRFVSTRSVSGFHQKWARPRPTLPAVEAGSVLVFPAGTDPGALDALVASGVGERLQEGHGRIAVNLHRRLIWAVSEASAPDAEQPAAGPETEELQDLRRRVLMIALLRALIGRARVDASRVSHPPSPTAVARLREAVRRTRGPRELLALVGQAERKVLGKALAKMRVGDQPFTDWLEAWVRGTDGRDRWDGCAGVTRTSTRLGLSVDILTAVQRDALLQAHLDAFFESLRRRAGAPHRPRPPTAPSPEVRR